MLNVNNSKYGHYDIEDEENQSLALHSDNVINPNKIYNIIYSYVANSSHSYVNTTSKFASSIIKTTNMWYSIWPSSIEKICEEFENNGFCSTYHTLLNLTCQSLIQMENIVKLSNYPGSDCFCEKLSDMLYFRINHVKPITIYRNIDMNFMVFWSCSMYSAFKSTYKLECYLVIL